MNAAPELLKAAAQGGAITAAAWSRTTSISSDALDSSKQ